MKKWFLHYQRFDAAIDLYCARLSGNKCLAQIAISQIAAINAAIAKVGADKTGEV